MLYPLVKGTVVQIKKQINNCFNAKKKNERFSFLSLIVLEWVKYYHFLILTDPLGPVLPLYRKQSIDLQCLYNGFYIITALN